MSHLTLFGLLIAALIAACTAYEHLEQSLWTRFNKTDLRLGAGHFAEVRVVEPLAHLSGQYVAKIYNRLYQDNKTVLNEIECHRSVVSSFVPKLYYSFYDPVADQWALVMDYAGRYSMEKLQVEITKRTFLNRDVSLLTFIIANLLEGLRDIHRSNVLHRDFMPRNLVVSESGFIHTVDFSNALIGPAGNMKMDVCKVCRIAARFMFDEPDRNVLPSVVNIRAHLDRWYFVSERMNNFLVDCIENPYIEHLQRNPLFDGFDWTGLRQQTMQSPLIEAVKNAEFTIPDLDASLRMESYD